MRSSSAVAIGLAGLSLAGFLYGLLDRGAPAGLLVAVVLVHAAGLVLALTSAGRWQWSDELRQAVPPPARIGGLAAVLLILGVIALPFVEPMVVRVESRTGLFTVVANLLIRGLAALVGLVAALYAASVFFPRSWGLKAGVIGAFLAALAAAFFLLLAWGGGRGLAG